MDSTISKEDFSDVVFRSICEDDYSEIKRLHEELFPVKYADSFYQDVCVGKGLHGVSIFSSIAVCPQTGEMVGFIIGQFVPTYKCEDTDLFSSTMNSSQPDCVCYILTLGLIERYRRSGMGTRLVQQCYEYAERNSRCGAIYLHVIHYNENAIHFYKKNKFDLLRELPEFYLIDGVHHTAHLYIRYLNGFKAPLLHSMSSVASDFAIQSFNFLSSLFTDVIGSSLSRVILSLNIMSPFGLRSMSENMMLISTSVSSGVVGLSVPSSIISSTPSSSATASPSSSLISSSLGSSISSSSGSSGGVPVAASVAATPLPSVDDVV